MRKTKGFTLVELLVVISIIALLLAMLLPSLNKARGVAQRVICANNLKTMALGDKIYSQESDDYHVPIYDGSTDDNWIWFQNPLFIKIIGMKGRFNREAAKGYQALTLPKEYKCPTDKRTVANGGLLVEGTDISGTSYGMNSVGLRAGKNADWVENRTGKGTAQALKTTQVENPSNKFFFMDSEWTYVDYWGARYTEFWDIVGDRRSSTQWDVPAYRHREGANVVFYDGHMKYLPKQQIFKVNNDDGEAEYWTNMQTWMPIWGRWYLYPPYY